MEIYFLSGFFSQTKTEFKKLKSNKSSLKPITN